MKSLGQSPYHLFRYQILPLSNNLQLSLDSNISSILELISEKNSLFAEALLAISHFQYSRTKITHKIELAIDNIYVMRFGPKKTIKIRDEHFKVREEEDHPNIRIIIDNNPSVQIAAVEMKSNVFHSSTTVADIIQENVSKYLKRFNLGVYFEPMFEESNFWDIVKLHPKKVIQISFELISPNLANISKNLKVDLKYLQKASNIQKTNLSFASDKNSYLANLNENELIDSLVKYSSEGGGGATLRVKGIKQIIRTKDQVKETYIDEFEVTEENSFDLVKYFKGILS